MRAATTSLKPSWVSMRGGATGYSQNTAKAITFVSTSTLRSGRYRSARRHHSQPSRPSVTMKWALS